MFCKRQIPWELRATLMKESDFVGVSGTPGFLAGEPTPAPGCFGQRVRNVKKMLEILRHVNSEECVSG